MDKPIIKINIEGIQGSGKSTLANKIARFLNKEYSSRNPISSWDSDDSYHLQNDFNIVEIRTIQSRKEAQNA